MLRTVLSNPSATRHLFNRNNIVSSTSIVSHYAKSVNAAETEVQRGAEALRIKMETKRLKELKEKQIKSRNDQRAERQKEKLKLLEKKQKEKQLQKQSDERVKKLKQQELERVRRRKEKEEIRAIEQKQREKLKGLNKKETKPKKDADAPKRAIPALFWFNSDVFPTVKAELTQKSGDKKVSLVDVTKVVREKFNALSEAEKAKYTLLAESDRERYAKEKAAYDKKRKAKYARPASAYMKFVNDVLADVQAKNPQVHQTERIKMIGTMWNNLPADQKQKYVDAAQKDRAEFEAKKQAAQKQPAQE